MASAGNVFGACTILNGKDSLGDHLTSVGADDVHAEDLVSLLLGEELDEAVGVEVGLGTRVGDEAELADVVLDTSGLEVLLSLTNPGDLRVSVDNRGNGGVVDVAVTVLDKLDSGDT